MVIKKEKTAGQIVKKAGWRTSEFWLTSLALVLGIVLASGVIPEAGWVSKAVGAAVGVLAQLGYTVARVVTKSRANELETTRKLSGVE